MYLQHFGFTDFPFSITAQSNELYLSQQYREATAHLFYSLQHPGGIIVLTGEVGTGKTTVARNFLATHGEKIKTAFIVNPRVSTSELIYAICQDLGIKLPRSRKTIQPALDAMRQFLLKSYQQNTRVVVLIDEAQHLTFDALEQLRLLTNLEANANKLVQIILVGQEELRTTLSETKLRQFHQRIVGHFHLRPLTLKQTGEYICHRLLQVNGSPRLIPASLYRLIYAHSSGVPRLINLLCDRALVGAYANNCLQVNRSVINIAMQEIPVTPHPVPATASTNTKPLTARKRNSQPTNTPTPSRSKSTSHTATKSADKTQQPEQRLSFAGVVQRLHSGLIPITLGIVLLTSAAFVGGWYLHQATAPLTTIQPAAVPDAIASLIRPPVYHQPGQRTPQQPATTKTPLQQPAGQPSFPLENSATAETSPISPVIDKDVALAATSSQTTKTTAIESLKHLPESSTLYAEYSQLLQLWGITDTPFDPHSIPCHTITAYQLTCAHITANLQLVRAIGLPVVFELTNQELPELHGKKFLLTGINDEQALLWSNQQYYSIATPKLAEEWQGTGHYFIRAPQDFRTAFRPQSTSKSIAWLIHALSEVDPKYSLNQSIVSYNAQLVHSVKIFQQQQGLKPDGIAGLRTVALLNQLLFAPPVLTTTFD